MLYSVIKFIRPLNITLGIITLFIVGYIVGFTQFNSFFNLSIVLACYMIAGNMLNDFMDIEIDRINKPNRFLVQYNINKNIIISVIIAFIVIGSFTALQLDMVARSIAIFFALPKDFEFVTFTVTNFLAPSPSTTICFARFKHSFFKLNSNF